MGKIIFLCLLLQISSVFPRVFAVEKIDESSARIDITSENSAFSFTNINSNGQLAKWIPEADKGKYWITEMALQPGAWQELWIDFTPLASGYVIIQLRGSYYLDLKTNKHKVWVDDISIKGQDAAVTNGSLEYMWAAGKNFIGWTWGDPSEAKYRQDPGFAHQGEICALIWHDSPLLGRVAVRAGEKYTFSAWFRRDSE